MKFIYHHLGLGDHIICNGLVRSLINPNEEYYMFVKPHNLTSVSFMYRDLSNLKFIVGDDNQTRTFLMDNHIKNEDLIIAGFYRHPNAKEFDDSFYLQNNLPFNYRWDKFFVDRDLKKEKELFNEFDVNEGEYVFLHDDISRGYEIDRNYIVNKDLKIITPKKELTDNAFDYCYLMEKSCESHFIDSTFKLIFDSLLLRNTNLFYHIKLKNNIYKDFTKSQSKLNFKLLL